MENNFVHPFVRFAIHVSFRSGERYGPRCCYVPSLYLIESGSGAFIYEDGRAIELHPGIILFLQPGIMHNWVSDTASPISFRCVFFEWSYRPKPGLKIPTDLLCALPELPDDMLLDAVRDTGIPECMVADSVPSWSDLFKAVSTEFIVLGHDDFPDSLAVHGQLLILLSHVYRLAKRQNNYTDPRIAKLLLAMEQQDGGSVETIGLWATRLGLSRSHFQALFREQTGFTPKWYWNRCRINLAKIDLRNTNDTITAIAEKHGFSSVHAFTKLFKKMENSSPSTYRMQSRLFR